MDSPTQVSSLSYMDGLKHDSQDPTSRELERLLLVPCWNRDGGGGRGMLLVSVQSGKYELGSYHGPPRCISH